MRQMEKDRLKKTERLLVGQLHDGGATGKMK